jgi:hypothetical protein
MLPLWQNFPVVVIPEVAYPYNWDWGAVTTPEPVLECIATQQSIMSNTYMIPTPYVYFLYDSLNIIMANLT